MLPVAERTNDEWLDQLRTRDGRAVADLRAALVHGLARVLAGRADPAAVEDFAQDAVLRVLVTLDSFRNESRFLTWALAVASRVAFNELRKARYRDVSLGAVGAEPVARQEPTANGEVEAIVAVLRRLIRTELTDRQRALIEGEISGVPQAVLIERLGTTRNAFYKLGHDARMKLRRALEVEGFTAEMVRAALSGASN